MIERAGEKLDPCSPAHVITMLWFTGFGLGHLHRLSGYRPLLYRDMPGPLVGGYFAGYVFEPMRGHDEQTTRGAGPAHYREDAGD